MPSPEAHALLGASKAHIYGHCTPSARIEEGIPEASSPYAAAGTLAHAIAETKARAYFLEPCTKRQLTAQLKPLRADPNYDKEMEGATDLYLDTLKELAMDYGSQAPSVALEVRVDFDNIVPAGFGTSDCIMVGGDLLTVVDYKNGTGVSVEAEMNPQMLLYALGALNLYGLIYGDAIKRVRMVIVQPHAGGVKKFETTRAEVEAWGENFRPIAQKAWNGEGDPTPGDWCQFCRAKAKCSARARALLEMEPVVKASPDPRLLTNIQIGDLLTRAKAVVKWAEDLEKYAFDSALAGRPIEGWKLVAGRTSRDWKGGTDAAFAQLQARGIQEAMLYERKPVTVAGLEKIVGKKEFETYSDLVEKKPGKPALVPESDPRAPYNAAEMAFGVVGNG